MFLDLKDLQTLLSAIAPLMAKAKKQKTEPSAHFSTEVTSARLGDEAIRAYYKVEYFKEEYGVNLKWLMNLEVFEYLTKITPVKTERWVCFTGTQYAYSITYNGVTTKTFSNIEKDEGLYVRNAQDSHQVTTLYDEEAATFVRTFSKAQYTDDMGLAPNLKCIGLTTYGEANKAQFQSIIGRASHSAVFFNIEQPFNSTEGVTDMRKDERPLVKVPYLVADVLAQKAYAKTKVEQLHFRAERTSKEKLHTAHRPDHTYVSNTEAHLSNGLTIIVQSETTDARWPVNGLTSACLPHVTYAKSTLLPLFREHLAAALKNPLSKGHKDFLVRPQFHPKWSETLTFKTNPNHNAGAQTELLTMNGDYLDGAFESPAYLQDKVMAFNAKILSEALEMLPSGNVTAKFPNEKYGHPHLFESGPIWVIVMPLHVKN
jgi:hypothetical protein